MSRALRLCLVLVIVGCSLTLAAKKKKGDDAAAEATDSNAFKCAISGKPIEGDRYVKRSQADYHLSDPEFEKLDSTEKKEYDIHLTDGTTRAAVEEVDQSAEAYTCDETGEILVGERYHKRNSDVDLSPAAFHRLSNAEKKDYVVVQADEVKGWSADDFAPTLDTNSPWYYPENVYESLVGAINGITANYTGIGPEQLKQCEATVELIRECIDLAKPALEKSHPQLFNAADDFMDKAPPGPGIDSSPEGLRPESLSHWTKVLHTEPKDWDLEDAEAIVRVEDSLVEVQRRGVTWDWRPRTLTSTLSFMFATGRVPNRGREGKAAPGPSSVCAAAMYALDRAVNSIGQNLNSDSQQHKSTEPRYGFGWVIGSAQAGSDALNQAKYNFDLAQQRYILDEVNEDLTDDVKEALEVNLKNATDATDLQAQIEKANTEGKEMQVAVEDGKPAPMTTHGWDAHVKAKGVVDWYYNRALYMRPATDELLDMLKKNPLNPALDIDKAIADYGSNKIAVLDTVLKSAVMTELRAVLMESTIFHDLKRTYVGSYWNQGLSHPLFLHIAAAIQTYIPFITPYHLEFFWAYNYDNTMEHHGDAKHNSNIGMHADQAVINYNMWCTPKDSIESGEVGLTVFPKAPPVDGTWKFSDYNHAQHETQLKIKEFLSGIEPVVVNYDYNRAVVFDSAFFHKSGSNRMKPGYAHRRINLTYLWGQVFEESSLNAEAEK